MITFASLPSTTRSRRGFSLIETVLALSIMGLAITALLGLLPHGIEMSRKAGNATAETRIMDTISARLANMPFTSIDAQNNERMLFDDQGVQLGDSANTALAVYVARVVVGDPAVGAKVPGVAYNQALLRAVRIQIASTPLQNFNFDSADPKSFRTVPMLVGPIIPGTVK